MENVVNITNSGCYMIINLINGKVYVGSSINLKKRFGRHRRELRANMHPNKHFQAAYNLSGIEAFEYKIIRYCDKKDCLFFEQTYLDIYWDNCKNCYNIYKTAGSSLGYIFTEDQKKALSKSHIGIQAGKKNGMYGKTGELCPAFGIPCTEEHKAAMSRERSGDKWCTAKMTWDQVREIRARYAIGNISQKELAKEYNMKCIGDILRNETWKDI